MPAIQPDAIATTSSRLYIQNFAGYFLTSNAYIKSVGDQISYTLSFYTINTIPDDSQIVVKFPI